MADQVNKSKGGGGKLSRTETVTVRLDPRLRYLAELAARKQRRTLSSFIEWAVERALDQVYLSEFNEYEQGSTSVALAEKQYHLWDVDEAERSVRLALNYPELLSYDEQVVWKLITECGFLWRGSYKGNNNEWRWAVDDKSLIRERLKEHWSTFKKVASGDLPASKLPRWAEKEPAEDTSSDFGDFSGFDDKVPF